MRFYLVSFQSILFFFQRPNCGYLVDIEVCHSRLGVSGPLIMVKERPIFRYWRCYFNTLVTFLDSMTFFKRLRLFFIFGDQILTV